jgi:uncharacterized protein
MFSAYPEVPRVRFPVMFQNWHHLTFLHWRFPVASIAARIPPPLEVESFDGAAWVGITPFWLNGLRPPVLPALPWLSAFPETNCRTYVRGPDGESGIWFFSLDAARAIAVAGARFAYGLPYAWSRMRVAMGAGWLRYESRRRWPDRTGMTRFEIRPGAPIESRELEIFLTARFRLYSFIRGRLTYTQVEHPPWPLYSARVTHLQQTLTDAVGLPRPQEAPIVHFSPGVQVRVSAPHLLRPPRLAPVHARNYLPAGTE